MEGKDGKDLSASSVAKGCADEGTWGEGPCPREGLVGTCQLPDSVSGTHYYYSNGTQAYDLARARAMCATVTGTTFTATTVVAATASRVAPSAAPVRRPR